MRRPGKGKRGLVYRPERVYAYMRMPICPALFAQKYVCVSQGRCEAGLSETSGLSGCVWGL